jgi:hypothetical protein
LCGRPSAATVPARDAVNPPITGTTCTSPTQLYEPGSASHIEKEKDESKNQK